MTEQSPRRRWLALLVSLNLLVWVAVAVALGMIASDRVDLGGEALVRTWHATAQVALQQAAARLPDIKASPAADTNQTVVRAPVADGLTAAPAAMTEPEIVSPGVLIAERQPTRTPQPQLIATQPTPTESAVAAPLLLSDPGLSNLAGLDAEMERSTPGRAVQIRYQEVALNQEVQILLRDNPGIPYRNVMIDLQRDQMVVTGDATVLGFRTGIEMVGRVVAVNCRPELEVRSISVLGVLTPGFVKDQVLKTLLQISTWYPADYPLCLEQIVLEEDRATVYGHCR